MYLSKRKSIAILFSLFFICTAILSHVCISSCQNHMCTGRRCPVCTVVSEAKRNVEISPAAGNFVVNVLFPIYLTLYVLAGFCLIETSLVSQKVRMDN